MLDVWHVMAGTEKKRGVGDDPINPDIFVLGTTMPVWKGTNHIDNNVGCIYNVSRTTVGSITQSNGATFQDLNIPFQVTITQPNQTFINCRFTYSHSADTNGGMAYVMSSAATNIRFERCEFEPTTPGDRYNGIYGHHFTAYRCAITKTVDGFGIYNQYAQPVQVKVHGNWVGHLAWFDDDSGGGTRPGGHNDGSGTHNDGIQHGSGTGVEIIGNFWQGAKYNALNPTNVVLNSDYMGYTLNAGLLTNSPPNSGADSDKYIGQGQVFLTQHSAYFDVNDITFTYNWLWNFDHGFKAMSNYRGSSSVHHYITNMTVKNNTFGGRPRNWGGSQLYYPLRYDSNCTVNGRLVTAGGVVSDVDSSGNPCDNVWDPGAIVSSTYGDSTPIISTPVRHRVDAVAAP